MIQFDELFNPSSKWFFPLRILILFFWGLAIYYQTFAFGFVFDDNMFIVNNPYIRHFKDIHYMWSALPITRLIGTYSFALNFSICHLNPRGYHIINFLIHLTATGLVWMLTRTLFKMTGWLSSDDKLREELAFIITLLFLVHPGQTQAVTYISQRYESIAAVFYFGSMCCYLHGRISSVYLHKILLFVGAGVLAILGILTKETSATIPVMILAVELIILNKDPLNFKKIPPLQLYVLISILGLLFAIFFMKIVRVNLDIYFHYRAQSQSHDGEMITSGKYLLTQLRVFLTFLRLLIVPINQNLDYDYPLSTGVLNPPLTLVGLCVIGIIVFLIFRLRKQWPLIAFGLAWILIAFSINTAPRENVIFEHKLYLISYGFFLATVCVLSNIIKDRKVLWGVLIAIIVIFSLVSYKRNQVWKNDFTLWQDVALKSPHKARPLINLGGFYDDEGNLDRALAYYSKAIELNPNHAEAYSDRGNIYQRQNNFNLSLLDYNKAIKIYPYFSKAYSNRGALFFEEGNFTQAITDFTIAIRLNPRLASAYLNRAVVYCQMKNYDKAWADVNEAEKLGVDVNPGFINMLKRDSGRVESMEEHSAIQRPNFSKDI